jgi:hypothetical protein
MKLYLSTFDHNDGSIACVSKFYFIVGAMRGKGRVLHQIVSLRACHLSLRPRGKRFSTKDWQYESGARYS